MKYQTIAQIYKLIIYATTYMPKYIKYIIIQYDCAYIITPTPKNIPIDAFYLFERFKIKT